MRQVRVEDVLAQDVEALASAGFGHVAVRQIGDGRVVAVLEHRVDQIVSVFEMMIERAGARPRALEQQRKRQSAHSLVAHDLQRGGAYVLVLSHRPHSVKRQTFLDYTLSLRTAYKE